MTLRHRQRTEPLARCSYLVLFVVALLLVLPGSRVIFAATVPSDFTDSLIASGLSNPTAMELAPDGRVFVCEQGGALRVIKNGALLSAPFLSVTVNSSGERGLLGIAFDPNFAINQYVYIYYTATTPSVHNRISRFTASGDIAMPGSELIILDLNNLSSATNHNGGAIHFGPDGDLYVAVGDNANGNNAQSLLTLHGKMLRIHSDGGIPTDNPFFNQTTGNNRAIWALGLRNPFTFSFQPGTARMFINDVGQTATEEINDGIAGSNYGWPNCEGNCNLPNPNFRNPIYTYSNDASTCAITGGTFYNPQIVQFPSTYVGNYFFADFCGGWIKTLDPASGNAVAGFTTGISSPVDIKVSIDGSLYYLARGTGSVHRIDYPGNMQPPTITSHPQNQTVAVGQSATFSVSATGTPPLNYQWQRNGADIAGETSSSFTLSNAQLSDNGALFRALVNNSFGTATSNTAQLTVTSNTPPTGTIVQPAEGTPYQGGQTINYAGTGSDAEDGDLAASAFTWRVDFHHDDHFHPFVPATSGSSTGSFTIPTTGETSANVWYRIHLTVRDSGELTHSSFRDILPRTSTITLQSIPSGLQLKLDGQPVTSPHSFVGVVGISRTLEAVSPQALSGTTYVFQSWSDGGAVSHSISTPATNTAFTAAYNASAGDTTPPVVSITNPQGATVPKKSTVILSATASDNVRVTRVEFYVNGTLQCTDATASYTCNWRVPNQPNRMYRIEAKAYDQAGNSGSAVIQVTSR